jgi:D-3-phosphoglycerate dehydrogenase / 2-oxoglutarate reductase
VSDTGTAGPLRVVVTDQVFPDVDTERKILAAVGAELVVAHGEDRDEVLRLAAEADGVLTTYFALDADSIRRLRRCRIIARYGIGVDNIDLEAASNAGITVTNVPDYCVEEVATHTVAMLLSLLRRLPAGDRLVRAGAWGVAGVRPLHRISTLTVGIVGFGRIGRRVCELLRPLGCRLIVHDPYVDSAEGIELTGLDRLLSESDGVSLHSPLTPETRGLIGQRELGLMRPDAVLVNTSRGPLVELQPLLDALSKGRLAGAALDVFEHEPPDVDGLAAVDNLLATPHVAFYSEEAIAESQTKAATQVARVLTGLPPDYPVN